MESSKKRNTSAPLLLLEACLWIILVIIAWWWALSAPGQHVQSAIYFASIVSIIAGVRGFVGHGRELITATGLFSLSTSMFIGYSGWALMQRPYVEAELKYVALAVVTGVTAQIATMLLAWKHSAPASRVEPIFKQESASWLVGAGMLSLGVATVVFLVSPSLRAWAEASAFTAVCLLTVGVAFRPDARIVSWGSVWVIAGLILYAEFFHSGAGRLRLVALACAVAVIYGLRFQKRRLKFLIIAIIPLAIAWLANDRLEFQESLAPGASEGRTGLESMVAPLNVLSLFLESFHSDDFTPAYGYNLLSVPAIAIPEFIWPNQPQALGYELVIFFAPEKYGDGIFSTVASWVGEAIFNFGWWGVPIVIVAAAIGLRFLDALLENRLHHNYTSVVSLLVMVLIAMVIGAIADYTWSGTHTYVARMLRRVPIFIVVLVAAWFHAQLGRVKMNEKPEISDPLKRTDPRMAASGSKGRT